MLTVNATCQQQNRPLLLDPVEAITAFWAGQPAPGLLPSNLTPERILFVFPIGELMDEATCLRWLEQYLHPEGLRCPRCGSTKRRDFRRYQAFPSYRCRDCQRPYTLVAGTAFEKTRQQPSTIVLLLRGVTQGVSTTQLAEELDLSYKQSHTLRKRLQDNANETAPQSRMEGVYFESDEVYQNAGKKRRRPYRPRRPATSARQ